MPIKCTLRNVGGGQSVSIFWSSYNDFFVEKGYTLYEPIERPIDGIDRIINPVAVLLAPYGLFRSNRISTRSFPAGSLQLYSVMLQRVRSQLIGFFRNFYVVSSFLVTYHVRAGPAKARRYY